jgi:hypothetical protein
MEWNRFAVLFCKDLRCLTCVRFVQRGSLWDMLRRAQADPALLPWSRRLKFAAEVHRTPSYLY